MKTLWSIQEMKLKILSDLFSLVAQYFDVSAADVEAGAGVGAADAEAVAGVGVADAEAVDGVNAENVKSRWIYLSLMYQSIHLFIDLYLSVDLFLCLSIYLYVVSSAIWTICNLYFFLHISEILFLLYSPLRHQLKSAYHIYKGVTTLFSSWWFLIA